MEERPPGWTQVTRTAYVVEEARGPRTAEAAFPGASVCNAGTQGLEPTPRPWRGQLLPGWGPGPRTCEPRPPPGCPRGVGPHAGAGSPGASPTHPSNSPASLEPRGWSAIYGEATWGPSFASIPSHSRQTGVPKGREELPCGASPTPDCGRRTKRGLWAPAPAWTLQGPWTPAHAHLPRVAALAGHIADPARAHRPRGALPGHAGRVVAHV